MYLPLHEDTLPYPGLWLAGWLARYIEHAGYTVLSQNGTSLARTVSSSIRPSHIGWGGDVVQVPNFPLRVTGHVLLIQHEFLSLRL